MQRAKKKEITPRNKEKRNRFAAKGWVRYRRKITADTDVHRFAFLKSRRYGTVDDIMSILKIVYNCLQKNPQNSSNHSYYYTEIFQNDGTVPWSWSGPSDGIERTQHTVITGPTVLKMDPIIIIRNYNG